MKGSQPRQRSQKDNSSFTEKVFERKPPVHCGGETFRRKRIKPVIKTMKKLTHSAMEYQTSRIGDWVGLVGGEMRRRTGENSESSIDSLIHRDGALPDATLSSCNRHRAHLLRVCLCFLGWSVSVILLMMEREANGTYGSESVKSSTRLVLRVYETYEHRSQHYTWNVWEEKMVPKRQWLSEVSRSQHCTWTFEIEVIEHFSNLNRFRK